MLKRLLVRIWHEVFRRGLRLRGPMVATVKPDGSGDFTTLAQWERPEAWKLPVKEQLAECYSEETKLKFLNLPESD